MCSSVVTHDGRCIWNCGELRNELGVPLTGNSTNHLPDNEIADHHCLCNVDIPKAIKAAGLSYAHDEVFDEYQLKQRLEQIGKGDG